MQIATNKQTLHEALDWRRHNRSIGLVICRGAPHRGQVQLIKACRARCDLSVIALLPETHQPADGAVQPPSRDDALLEELGIDLLFAPSEEALLPAGERTHVALPTVRGAALAGPEFGRCERWATLVLRLCNLVQPTDYFHGEQYFARQFMAARALTELDQQVTLIQLPLVREADGLAASSRNLCLTPSERRCAHVLPQTLKDLAHALKAGARHFEKLEQTARVALRGAGLRTDLVTICDGATLEVPTEQTTDYRIIAVARLGRVRLSDTVAVQSTHRL